MPPIDAATLWGIGVNLGIGGIFLTILFLGLARGKLRTQREFSEMQEAHRQRMNDKDDYIRKIEQINEKLDDRNDLLARQIGPVLEISRAHGMLEALPSEIGERIIKP